MVVQLLPQDVRAGGDGEMERQEGREFPPPQIWPTSHPGDLLLILWSDP